MADDIITFGKYKDKGISFQSLALSDRRYVEWLQREAYSPTIRRKATDALQATAEQAKNLDEFDLDTRYREEYSLKEIEQMRRERDADRAQAEAEEQKFDAKHLACKWQGSRYLMSVYAFAGTPPPITVYLDYDGYEFNLDQLRELTARERDDPAYREVVAVLDNGEIKIGLTEEHRAALFAKCEEVNP